MNATTIEWTDATWNPVTGCSKVTQGCKHCYAERRWARLSAPGQPYAGRAFTDVRYHPERLENPLRWRKPRLVFVNSMSDLFHEDVPDDFISRVFAVMGLAPQHRFQVLTKRPERMRQFIQRLRPTANGRFWWRHWSEDMQDRSLALPWPMPNVWLGVSVEDQHTADERIPLLAATPAAVRFVSVEPLLGQVDLGHATASDSFRDPHQMLLGQLHWVIVGGESGPRARPAQPDWARSLRDRCLGAGVPFLFKQWGEWSPVRVYEDRRFHGGGAYESTLGGRSCASGGRFRRWSDVEGSERVGRKAAGRLLDGRTWDEYPRSNAADPVREQRPSSEGLVGHRLQGLTPT